MTTSLTLPLLAVGAVGVISVAAHWCAPDFVEMFDAWDAGDTGRARAVNARLLESFAFETGDEAPNPGPSKAMLRHLGQPAGHCRPPMGADPDWLDARAAEVYANLLERAWLNQSASSSSAGSGRSGATAWRSSRAPATAGGSCSSTAG